MTWPHNGKKFFFCSFQLKTKKIEKNRKNEKKNFDPKKPKNFDLKWPLEGRDIFFWPWCQYKSCRYWWDLSKYAKWAKSNDAFSLKVAKSAKSAHFEPKKIFLAKKIFFFENRASSLFLFYYALIYCKKSKKSYGGKYHNFCHWQTDWQTSMDT